MAVPQEEVSVADAKRDIADVLGEAPEQPVVITRKDEPDAVVLSYDDYVRLRRRRAAQGMREIAQRMSGRHIDVQSLLDESRQELEERS